MRDIVPACAAGKADDKVLLDLNKEEDNYGQADVPIAIVPSTDEIVLLQMDGNMTREAVSADEETIQKGISEKADKDGPSLKFCGSGYAIVKCTLRDTDRTKGIMSDIDSESHAFLSSYKSKDLRKSIADRVPELRSVLLARR